MRVEGKSEHGADHFASLCPCLLLFPSPDSSDQTTLTFPSFFFHCFLSSFYSEALEACGKWGLLMPAGWLPNLHGPVSDENVGPLDQNVLRISGPQQQENRDEHGSVRPRSCYAREAGAEGEMEAFSSSADAWNLVNEVLTMSSLLPWGDKSHGKKDA